MTGEKEYLYWLCRIPFLGAVRIKRMWEHFQSFHQIYNIEGIHLAKLGLIRETEAGRFQEEKRKLSIYAEEYHSLEKRGIQFITFLDEAYPQRLRLITDAPMGLYVRGGLPEEHLPTAAIIGARSCSGYGTEIAKVMGRTLAQHGVQIISGLAAGIDAAGHWGAVEGEGAAFGVLGCGINICYPKENYHLYEKVEECGGVISEFPLGAPPKAGNFPMRNRIISGLADVILVIEAREKSGSLITAELALEQGKDVFAVPGRITDALSLGCNKLIADGAGVLLSSETVLDFFGIPVVKNDVILEKSQNGLAKAEKMVYSCLDLRPKFLEEIVRESGLSISSCMSALLELELRGMVVQTSNHYYGRKL